MPQNKTLLLMQFFRSLVFSIFVNAWGAIIPIIYIIPAFISRDKKIADRGAKIWSIGVFWMLKKICKIDYKIIGIENILKEPCIYACKHQSMWETVIMHLIIDHKIVLTENTYGDLTYASSIFVDNIFACQFHPEKSADEGLKIYHTWAVINNLIR
jgi:hypothetical protein